MLRGAQLPGLIWLRGYRRIASSAKHRLSTWRCSLLIKPSRLMVFIASGFTLMLAFAVTPAFAGTYFNDSSMTQGQEADSGYAYWSENTVYRPTGHTFALWYSNSANSQAGYQTDASDNPFTDYGPYGYSDAYCQNISGGTVSPVTCIAST